MFILILCLVDSGNPGGKSSPLEHWLLAKLANPVWPWGSWGTNKERERDTVIQTRQATMASSLKKLVLYPLLLQLVSMFRAAPSTLEQVPRSLYFTIDLKSRGSLGPYSMTNPLHQLIEPWYHLPEENQFSSEVSQFSVLFPSGTKIWAWFSSQTSVQGWSCPP